MRCSARQDTGSAHAAHAVQNQCARRYTRRCTCRYTRCCTRRGTRSGTRRAHAACLQQPPRRRHQQIHWLLEHSLLRALGHAAVHGRHADAQRPAERACHVAHLQRQLARGKQHERTRPARPRTRAALLLVRPERLHDGQEVSEGLARAGPRADEHVGPAGERWHHPPLQIVRLCDAHFLERVTELAAEAELGERRGDGGGCRRAPMGHARLCERRRQLVRAREGDGRRQHDDERTSRPNFSHAAR